MNDFCELNIKRKFGTFFKFCITKIYNYKTLPMTKTNLYYTILRPKLLARQFRRN